jgi:hypothetical protein
MKTRKPKQADVWPALAEAVSGDYRVTKRGKPKEVRVEDRGRLLTLDTYTVSTGQSSTTYTRVRAFYRDRDGFQFKLSSENPFTRLFARLGMQDIVVGWPALDQKYVIKSNDPAKVKQLMMGSAVGGLLAAAKPVGLSIKSASRKEKKALGPDVVQLSAEVTGVEKDPERLKWMLAVVSETLDYLARVGSAGTDRLDLENPPGQLGPR